jgi:hypothetical protein
MVRLYAVESTENWFEDAGSGQLSNGGTFVSLDSAFAQTINGNVEYHVSLTPKGDCEGLYISNETAHGFEVHELRGGHSNIAFDYRIMAKRKGYESIRMEDVTTQFASMKVESARLAASRRAPSTSQSTSQSKTGASAQTLDTRKPSSRGTTSATIVPLMR